MCKYCDGEENIKISGGWCGTDGATISNAKLSVEISYETACMNINYCPMCGKNLEEQSNELNR